MRYSWLAQYGQANYINAPPTPPTTVGAEVGHYPL